MGILKENVRDAIVSGDGTIGALVMWSLDRIEVPRPRFESFFASVGFDDVRLASRTPKFSALLRRAAAECRASLPDGWLLREASKTRDRIVFGCIREHRDDSSAMLTHSQKANVAVFRDGSIATNDPSCAPSQLLVDRYEFLRDNATTADVSKAMVTAILHSKAMAGVCFAGRGGTYFLHPDHIPAMRTIAAWVKSHGGPRTEVSIFEIGGTDHNREQAASKLSLSLSDACGEVLDGIRVFAEQAVSKNESLKPYVLDRREAEFLALEKRVEGFSSVLGEMRTTLIDEISQARAEMYNLAGLARVVEGDHFGMGDGQ